MKKIRTATLLLLLTVIGFTACNKNKDVTPPAKTNEAKFTMDGKSYTVNEKNISSVLYKTDGDAVKAMDLIIPVDNGTIKFYVADLKTGTVSLTKKTGTAAWINSSPTIARSVLPNNTVALGGVTTVSNNGQTYVKYYLSGNSFYGLSGTIELTYNEATGDYTYKWNITFKDSSGKEFTSSGNYAGNIKTATVKPKSTITDPTPVTPAPTVESINPAQGKAGDVVTITGTNFSTVLAENTVSFNGVAANVKTATATQITVDVPAATTGAVTVKVGTVEATNKPAFTYQTSTGGGAAFNREFENLLWPTSVGIDADQNFYVSGMYTPDASGGNMNFQMYKINSSGNIVKRYVYSDFGYSDADKMKPSILAIDNNWNGEVFIAVSVNNVHIKVFKVTAGATTPQLVYTINSTADQNMFEKTMCVNNAGEIFVHDFTSAVNYYKYSATGVKSDFILGAGRGDGKLSCDQAGNIYVYGRDQRYTSGHTNEIYKIAADKTITTMPFVLSGTGYMASNYYFKSDKDGKYLVGTRNGLEKFDMNTSATASLGTLTNITATNYSLFAISLDNKWAYGCYMTNASKYNIFKVALP